MTASIIALGGTEGSPILPFWKCFLVLYLFLFVVFLVLFYVLEAAQNEKDLIVKRIQWATITVELSICAMIACYEFWVEPSFKHYYELLLGGVHLPLFTYFLLYLLPRGLISFIAFAAFSFDVYLLGMRAGGKSPRELRMLQMLFICLGLFSLIFVPIVLMLPMCI